MTSGTSAERTAKSLYARRRLIPPTGMGGDEKRKAFLKGFEEGRKAAWREIGSLTTRGYSSTELMVMAKSKVAVLLRGGGGGGIWRLPGESSPLVGGGR